MMRKIDDGPVHMTEEGLVPLREKLARLKKSLPELISETQRTADYGDRSENAEYKEAKSALRSTHRQILNIQGQIKRVVIIKSGVNASETVEIGSTVVIEAEGIKKTFQILGSHETDPARGRISFSSPLGAALMHHRKGDTITIQTQNAVRKYLIIEIK